MIENKFTDWLSWLKQTGVSQRIIKQFLYILTAAIVVLTAGGILYNRSKLLGSLSDKAVILTESVADASVDALSVGDKEKLSQLTEKLLANDRDVLYARIVARNGKCLGSTDRGELDKDLSGTKEGKAALDVEEFTILRDLGFGKFRAVQPIRFVYNKLGYLEIAYTTKNINLVILYSALLAMLMGAAALWAGASAYMKMTARHITEPLGKVMTVSAKISEGDLTAEILGMSCDDEICELAATFDKMAENLRKLIGSVNAAAGTATRSADDVARNTAQSSETMKQIQGAVSQIAAATSAVAANAQQISSLISDANKSAQLGTESVAKVMDSFDLVRSTIKTTDESVAKLEQRSREIAGILALITKIADQTNMLALNAAIEAARAGEAGRGFSVVADEVRKLAESSNNSASKIAVIVREIQADTAGVVATSNRSIAETKKAAELMGAMQAGYASIAEAVRGISQQVEQIAATAEETAASAEEVTAGTEEQTAAIAMISGSANDLRDQARTLQDQVAVFKI